MRYRSSLSIAKGLGSAKTGTYHWWMQRVSSVVLLISSFWALRFLGLCQSGNYSEVLTWLQQPISITFLSAWFLSAFYHAALGLQVVIEDYVHSESVKIISIWLIKIAFAMLSLFLLITLFHIL